MFYVVKCGDLQELKRKWDEVVSSHRDEIPNARFDQTTADFQQLVQDLGNHSRIRWFYYSANSEGIAVRLYDRDFMKVYPKHYRETPNGNGEEWVIIRGRGFGSPLNPCKRQMLDAFGENRWNVRDAPPIDQNNASGTFKLGTDTNDRIAYFEHLNNAPGGVMPALPTPLMTSNDLVTEATEVLQQFRQIIFYGPPGTGKTRLARLTALALLAPEEQRNAFNAFPRTPRVGRQLDDLRDHGAFDLVVFHPAYEYEQFIGGITPKSDGGNLSYQIEPGIFLKMARWVEENGRPAVLIIDEINRGNLPKLLGELLYALEYRDTKVRLPFAWNERSELVVPKDLYIIGTMNSSDRSIGHIDVAVRRRFGLLHIEPEAEIIRALWRDFDPQFGDHLARLMARLNTDLGQYDRGGELRVGHAYFLPDFSLSDPKKQVERKWFHQVNQLLEEYGGVLNLDDAFFTRYPKVLANALSHVG
ncbi:MAG TPA: AAA family ATPase [Candidatus Saccharimonadales bacterium]|nr:AAA family ATPase [Candidatus Saccharimonadales bacterium]